MNPLRRIAHLDMDAFFASVELLRYPQLKGLPMVIGGGRRREAEMLERLRAVYPDTDWGPDTLDRIPPEFFPRLADYVGRGVATTATYAARQFGVGSAMGLMKAAKLCPQAILLPVDFDEVKRLSREFKRVITEIAPVMEDRGVDEVYIDFTDVPGGQREGGRVLALYIDFTDVPGGQREGGRVLARLIQKSIHQATGLTCSIGVAPNKLLAKLASEFNKPNGISIVMPDDLQRLIWPLPCRKLNGIGPKADERLKAHGITTIGELAAREPDWLTAHFGKSYGAWLHDAAWGRDERPVVTQSEPVSMSRETTFERDLHAVHDRAELGALLTRLCEQVSADLRRKGYFARTIGVKLTYVGFTKVTRDLTLDTPTDETQAIRRAAGLCLKRVDLTRRFRLLGVRASKLVKPGTAEHAAATQNAPQPKPRDKAYRDEHTDLLFPELD